MFEIVRRTSNNSSSKTKQKILSTFIERRWGTFTCTKVESVWTTTLPNKMKTETICINKLVI